MLQPKDTDWLNRYKNKTHTYADYKNPLQTRINPIHHCNKNNLISRNKLI